MRALNLGLRFVLELAALAALAYWGYTAHVGMAVRLAFAVLAPLVAATFWGTFVAPKASVSLSPLIKQTLALFVFLIAAAALGARGHRQLGAAFILIALVNALVLEWSARSGDTR